MSGVSQREHSQDLFRAILTLQTEDECRRFLEDLCTFSELEAMKQRYDVADLLDQGLVYAEVMARTGASSATVSRVNRALHHGEDGYRDVLRRMQVPQNAPDGTEPDSSE